MGAAGFVAVASIVAFFVGIYFILRGGPYENKEEIIAGLKKQPAYQDLSDDQIKYLLRWSWGAFLSPTIWAFGNKMYIMGVISLIPIGNLYAWLTLSASGRRLAWEEGWENFDTFQKRQKIVAIIIAIEIGIVLILGYYYDVESSAYSLWYY